MTDSLHQGRIAGIDYGTKRIGIAIADASTAMASAYENYSRRTPALDAQRFERLAQDEAITLFVVGLPVHLDGRESQKSIETREFGDWLKDTTGIEVEFFDERFTSLEAEQMLQAANLTKKRRQARLDMLAAQIMLTAYLESHTKSQEPPGAIDD